MINTSIQRLQNGGAWVPSISVFTGGKNLSVHTTKTATHVLTLAEHGAEGVIINGTTGAGHLLKHSDKIKLIVAVGALKSKGLLEPSFILITGTGTENSDEAVEIIHTAQANGFDGVMALPPKDANKKEAFYRTLAAACNATIGLVLYHHPRLDPDYSVTPELLGNLMHDFPCVIGVKDSSANKALLYEWQPTVQKIAGRTPLLAVGEDFFIAEGLAKAGAQAAIAGAANTQNGLTSLRAIFKAHRAGKTEEMHAAQTNLDTEINILLKKGVFRDNAKARRIRVK